MKDDKKYILMEHPRVSNSKYIVKKRDTSFLPKRFGKWQYFEYKLIGNRWVPNWVYTGDSTSLGEIDITIYKNVKELSESELFLELL